MKGTSMAGGAVPFNFNPRFGGGYQRICNCLIRKNQVENLEIALDNPSVNEGVFLDIHLLLFSFMSLERVLLNQACQDCFFACFP